MAELQDVRESAPLQDDENFKRFFAGIIFTAIGLTACLMTPTLRLGSLTSLGPGGFPAILAGLLTILGIAHIVTACTGGIPKPLTSGWTKRAVYLIPLSVVAFGVMLERIGLVPAAIISVFIGGLANPHIRLPEVLIISLALAAFAALLFVELLGLPLKLFWYR